MDWTHVERISVRIALAVGFCVTVALWVYTGYAFTERMSAARDDAAAVTARYDQAQQLLTTVRTQVLLISVRVRDALLTADASGIAEDREQIEEAYRVILMAVQDYEPVVRSADESGQVFRLREELDRFHQASLGVLNDATSRAPAAIRDALNRNLMPRREAALFMSEEIQALNRRAYIAQQTDIAAIHQAAERKSRQQLGIALALSLGVLFLTSLYAGKLDARLRMQLKRDVRLSRELHDTTTKLIAAQAAADQSRPPGSASSTPADEADF